MSLVPIETQVRASVSAAQAVRRAAIALRAESSIQVEALARFANALQARFEEVRPIMAFEPAEVQAAAAKLYGSRRPADVLALVAAGQAPGAAVVAAIAGAPASPASLPAYAWTSDGARLAPRVVAGVDIAFLAAPLDALIAALEPIDG